MNKKIILYGLVIFILAILIIGTFVKPGTMSVGKIVNNIDNSDYSYLPEKCQPPAGQDINSWKEHLGHHAETKDCLDYFK